MTWMKLGLAGVSEMLFNCDDEDDWADNGFGKDELSGLKSAMTGLKSSGKYLRATRKTRCHDTELRSKRSWR